MWILGHSLGGRADLPLPIWMFGYGAAAALVVSFAALALFWPTPRLEQGTLDGNAAVLANTAGLLWAIGMAALAYVGAMRVAARLVDDRLTPEELRAAFVHSLVPIVLAYAVAHYFSLLLRAGRSSSATWPVS